MERPNPGDERPPAERTFVARLLRGEVEVTDLDREIRRWASSIRAEQQSLTLAEFLGMTARAYQESRGELSEGEP